MRDRETIDSELRRLAAMRRSLGEPSSRQIDALLDERLGHRPEVFETGAVDAGKTSLAADTWSQRHETSGLAARRRNGMRRRFGLLTTLPLSLVAAGAVISYCPQYQPATLQPAVPDQLEQTFQKAQSDLQAIQGDLQGIRDALPNGQP